LNLLKALGLTTDMQNNDAEVEVSLIEKMQKYIEEKNITIFNVYEMLELEEDEDDAILRKLLGKIRLPIMLKTYCDGEKNQKINYFYDMMKELNVNALYARRLEIDVFDVIKKKAEAAATVVVNQFITPTAESNDELMRLLNDVPDNNSYTYTDVPDNNSYTNTIDDVASYTHAVVAIDDDDDEDVPVESMIQYQYYIKKKDESDKEDEKDDV